MQIFSYTNCINLKCFETFVLKHLFCNRRCKYMNIICNLKNKGYFLWKIFDTIIRTMTIAKAIWMA